MYNDLGYFEMTLDISKTPKNVYFVKGSLKQFMFLNALLLGTVLGWSWKWFGSVLDGFRRGLEPVLGGCWEQRVA